MEATTAEIINAGGTVVGLVLAVLGYHGWKRQLIITRRFEVAQDVVRTLARFELSLFNIMSFECPSNGRVNILNSTLDEFQCEIRVLNALFDTDSTSALRNMMMKTHDFSVMVRSNRSTKEEFDIELGALFYAVQNATEEIAKFIRPDKVTMLQRGLQLVKRPSKPKRNCR